MQSWEAPAAGRVVFIRMDRGDDFLDTLQERLRHHGVRHGVVMSVVATLERCVLHQAQGTGMPIQEKQLVLDGPVEVMQISGIVADGTPHLHASVADRDGRAYGGHLDPGSRVLYLAEVSILETPAAQMARRAVGGGLVQLVGTSSQA